ncbi:hypothetical protein DDZ14_01420 [Maritimibacter sp. 55A14]|uniref:hypothetical protein n=1 Tax=Maritimibacter sp. 55A14 TaxID=2174844 RepID=UPI000D612670|nr:hypothetical protein [Maritimibacter sp. 55A14]PWE34448.1 hypothetical protein DDZ14_01420 [Maritimibacter sp. 55A14]
MEWLVYIGAVFALAGFGLLVWCILRVARARRANLSDEALRAEVQKVVAPNLGALFLSALGLMMIVVGLFLN